MPKQEFSIQSPEKLPEGNLELRASIKLRAPFALRVPCVNVGNFLGFFFQNQLALGHSGQYGQFWTKILIFEHDFLKHPRPIRALDFEFFP